jgi:hypothetical protein
MTITSKSRGLACSAFPVSRVGESALQLAQRYLTLAQKPCSLQQLRFQLCGIARFLPQLHSRLLLRYGEEMDSTKSAGILRPLQRDCSDSLAPKRRELGTQRAIFFRSARPLLL